MQAIYDDWQTFISNTGLKIFSQIDDLETGDVLVRLLGEQEVMRQQKSGNRQFQTSKSVAETVGRQESSGRNEGTSWKSIWLPGGGTTTSEGISSGESLSASSTRTKGTSQAETNGWQESVHRRALLNADEIRLMFARVDTPTDPKFPGLLLVVSPGRRPVMARRVNYYNSPHFRSLFDPHPDHAPTAATATLSPPVATTQVPRTTRPVRARRWMTRAALLAGAAAVLLPCGRWLFMRDGASASPPVPQALRAQSAFDEGAADRKAWEVWFATTSGATRAGAEFWADQRSLSNRVTCAAAARASTSDGPAWLDGCVAARGRLDPTDVRRSAEPEYRRGWNSS